MTVSPPVVRLLPLASLSSRVTVNVDVASAAIEVGEAVINEVAAEAAPVVKLTSVSNRAQCPQSGSQRDSIPTTGQIIAIGILKPHADR